MALRWLLHSTYQVLGYPKATNSTEVQDKQILGYPNGKENHADQAKSFKGLPQERPVAMEQLVDYPSSLGFQMPLHYPRYTKADYENLDEWRIDLLLKEYGLINFKGTLDEKRAFAVGAFLWPGQY